MNININGNTKAPIPDIAIRTFFINLPKIPEEDEEKTLIKINIPSVIKIMPLISPLSCGFLFFLAMVKHHLQIIIPCIFSVPQIKSFMKGKYRLLFVFAVDKTPYSIMGVCSLKYLNII